jgi:2-polyprenyl-3-methyl-5-hydroxy-6-metoxy-1,4-benzoquinol methylase
MASCLFCNSSALTEASFPKPTSFNQKVFHYKHCDQCGLVFIDPLPSDEDFRAMYPIAYHDEFYFKGEGVDYSFLYNHIQSKLTGRKILDYGCGDGGFLKYMQAQGFSCTGVEYNPALVAKLAAHHTGISFLSIDDFWNRNDEQYEVIHLGDVFEHLTAPYEFLMKITGKLTPAGVLVVHGPIENNPSLGLGLRKLTSTILGIIRPGQISGHVPYHTIFSTAANQKLVLERAGLKERYFHVYETPWPYPEQWSPRPGTSVKYLLGQLSLMISRLSANSLGNRFIYVGGLKEVEASPLR